MIQKLSFRLVMTISKRPVTYFCLRTCTHCNSGDVQIFNFRLQIMECQRNWMWIAGGEFHLSSPLIAKESKRYYPYRAFKRRNCVSSRLWVLHLWNQIMSSLSESAVLSSKQSAVSYPWNYTEHCLDLQTDWVLLSDYSCFEFKG